MARKGSALAYLSGTLTQGSNDAFIQLSIATALTGQTKTVYRMASLDIEWPAIASVNAVDYQFAITRKSYAAFPTSMNLEKSNIVYRRRNVAFTTSGLWVANRQETITWSDDDAPIIVEDPIYAQFDSASTSATNVAYFRIGYWLDSISEVDRLQLIANSLS